MVCLEFKPELQSVVVATPFLFVVFYYYSKVS